MCPSDPNPVSGQTSYMMIVGKHTVGGEPGDQGVTMSQLIDGSRETLLIVEVPGKKVNWMEPKDITIDELIAQLDMRRANGGSPHIRGFSVAFCDGSVTALPFTIDREMLRRLAIINDGKPVNVEDLGL